MGVILNFVLMKSVKFILSVGLSLALSFGLYSCSQEDVFTQDMDIPVSRTSLNVVNEYVTVGELVKLVGSNCQDYELNFLNSLPQDMKVYVYSKGSKNYPALQENKVGEVLSLVRDNSIDVIPLEMKSPDELRVTTKAATRGYTVSKSVYDVPIAAFNGFFGYGEIVGTANYIYDVEEHIVTEAQNIICDIDNNYIGEYVLDWLDRGSTLSVSSDKLGLLYNVNGDLVLGVAMGGLPVGFVCVEYRGKTGEIVVPY